MSAPYNGTFSSASASSHQPPHHPPQLQHHGSTSSSASISSQQLLSSTNPKVMIPQANIQRLVASIGGPDERLDPDVEPLLLDLADDFVEDIANFACMLAKHRQSHTVDVQDVQLYLEKHWQMHIPGFAAPDGLLNAPTVGVSGPSSTLAAVTGTHVRNLLPPSYGIGEAHRKRMALVAKARAKEAKRVAAVQANAPDATMAASDGAQTNGTTKAAPSAASSSAAAKKRKRPNEEQQ